MLLLLKIDITRGDLFSIFNKICKWIRYRSSRTYVLSWVGRLFWIINRGYIVSEIVKNEAFHFPKTKNLAPDLRKSRSTTTSSCTPFPEVKNRFGLSGVTPVYVNDIEPSFDLRTSNCQSYCIRFALIVTKECLQV